MPIAPSMYPMLIFFAILGLVMGSFGNVLICRIPKQEKLTGRSHCVRCKHTLGVWELIPVLSFVALGGKCAKCKKKISWQYPIVEICSSALFVLAFLHEAQSPLSGIVLALALWLLLIMGIIDGKTGYLPDSLNLPFVALSIVYAALNPPFDTSGVLLGGGVFLVQWIGSKGRWIGSGDVILSTGIGALLGSWEYVALYLFIAYVTGGAYAAILLYRKEKKMNSKLSFGPFLSAGAIVMALFGSPLLMVLREKYLQ